MITGSEQTVSLSLTSGLTGSTRASGSIFGRAAGASSRQDPFARVQERHLRTPAAGYAMRRQQQEEAAASAAATAAPGGGGGPSSSSSSSSSRQLLASARSTSSFDTSSMVSSPTSTTLVTQHDEVGSFTAYKRTSKDS